MGLASAGNSVNDLMEQSDFSPIAYIESIKELLEMCKVGEKPADYVQQVRLVKSHIDGMLSGNGVQSQNAG